jgi:hypothetical protein
MSESEITPQGLLSLAKEINSFAKNLGISKDGDENIRIKMGHLLYAVQKRFGKHDTPMFRKWCYENIRKADGNPFSHVTLCNYIKYANNPTLMPKERERQKMYSRNRTKAIKYLNGDNPVNGTNHAEQVNRLVYA